MRWAHHVRVLEKFELHCLVGSNPNPNAEREMTVKARATSILAPGANLIFLSLEIFICLAAATPHRTLNFTSVLGFPEQTAANRVCNS